MAIAGSYVYDDDGVFNPDNITIQPGTFIPRSPGSAIESLQSAGRFDVAQLVIDDMRRNVRKALFIDELDTRPNARTPLSATEVSERLADVARDMGAVAGRMQKEFLQPLVERLIYIYTKQGLLDIPKVDGRELRIVPVSPCSERRINKTFLTLLGSNKLLHPLSGLRLLLFYIIRRWLYAS